MSDAEPSAEQIAHHPCCKTHCGKPSAKQVLRPLLLTSWGLLGTAPCRWDAPEPRTKQEHSPGTVRPCSQFAVWWGKHCWLQCLRVPNARAVVNRGRESKGQGGNWERFKAQNGKWDAVGKKALSTSRPGHGHFLPVTEHWDKQDRVNTDSEKTQEQQLSLSARNEHLSCQHPPKPVSNKAMWKHDNIEYILYVKILEESAPCLAAVTHKGQTTLSASWN